MTSCAHLMVPFVTFILFIIFLFKWYFNTRSTARKRLTPSPPKLPVIGNLHKVGLYPHRSLQALSNRYGSLMMLHLGNVVAVIVSSADAAREIMKNQDLIFSNRPESILPDEVVYGSKDIVFAAYGDYIPGLKWINHINGFDARVEKLAKLFDEFWEGVIEEHTNKKKGETNPNGRSIEAHLVDILLEIQRENKSSFDIGTDCWKISMVNEN
ncbi:Cytochrome [Abeliophyllum distichum]|uniref:Cytochrome n=1 Tax=Abeliophyllum distichum TaxID=126358 RepID=A0ABD1RTW7_9LAMI